MKNLIIYISLTLLAGEVYAQSNLPDCQGIDVSKWTNCQGQAIYPNGDKYYGEFKNGQRWGFGILTWPDGKKYIGEHQADNLNTQNNTVIFPDGHKRVTVNGQVTNYPANDIESKTRQSDNELTSRNSLNLTITKFCKGKPKVLLSIFENIAALKQVNPNSITLNRVEVVSESMRIVGMDVPETGSQEAKDELYYGCNGIFYSPNGPFVCNLHFYNNGDVANVCDSTIIGGIGDADAITRTLTNKLKDLYWKRILSKQQKPNQRPGQTCYDLANGRAIPCKN